MHHFLHRNYQHARAVPASGALLSIPAGHLEGVL
jgi:hypothetical protein